jgi:hypothetical protein
MTQQSKLSARIAARLVALGTITPEEAPLVGINRLYPGYWQRTEGAWSWDLVWFSGPNQGRDLGIGSQWTATECLAAPFWEWYGGAISPGKEPA